VTNQLADLADFVATEVESLKLNTAIAGMMKWLNAVSDKQLAQLQKEQFAIILASFAPFMTAEIWYQWGHRDSIHQQAWPQIQRTASSLAAATSVAVQVNGKFRATIELPAEADQDQAIEQA